MVKGLSVTRSLEGYDLWDVSRFEPGYQTQHLLLSGPEMKQLLDALTILSSEGAFDNNENNKSAKVSNFPKPGGIPQ